MNQNLKRLALLNRGHCNFDYDQTTDSGAVYNLMVGQGPAALSGLCLSLSMIYLRLHRNPPFTQVYRNVILQPLEQNALQGYSVQIAHGLGGWQAQTVNIMGTFGFNHVGTVNINRTLNLENRLRQEILNCSFAILVYHRGAHSHAIALRILNHGVHFFDPNEGEVVFWSRDTFHNWFFEYLNDVLPANPAFFDYIIMNFN